MDRCGLYERQRASAQKQSGTEYLCAYFRTSDDRGTAFSRFLAKSLTYPLQRLRDSMSRVQEGHFDGADVEIDSENEIGSLTKSFNVMTHRIQDLMEQNVKEQEAKRKSELKALQSQINPHFLYNTLDSIIWMAEGRKYEEVVLMTASLARLLRQSISNEDEVVPLARKWSMPRVILRSRRCVTRTSWNSRSM